MTGNHGAWLTMTTISDEKTKIKKCFILMGNCLPFFFTYLLKKKVATWLNLFVTIGHLFLLFFFFDGFFFLFCQLCAICHDAAIHFFNWLRNQFGSWFLVSPELTFVFPLCEMEESRTSFFVLMRVRSRKIPLPLQNEETT
jgi:hypothetical protein